MKTLICGGGFMEDNKELVRYHNDMNKYALGALKEKELDLFFSICYRLKKDRVSEVTLDFYELRNLAEFDNKNLSRFIASIKNVIKKFSSLLVEVGKDENNCTIFPLFDKYKISSDSTSVSFRMHEDYKYLLFSDFSLGHFTEFELKQFISLKSGYSKNIFKFLKQNHYKGVFKIELTEFRRILDIPKAYRMTHINDRVLKPALEELAQYFLNLKLEKIKSGKTVSKLLFTWEKGIEVIPEKQVENRGKSKIDVPHGEQLDMFQEKKIKKAEIELTDEEQERRKENIKKQLNSLTNNFKSEQKIDVVENETPIFTEEIKKNSEQINLDVVPGEGIAPGEEKYSQEILAKVKEYGYHIGYLESAMFNFDIGVDEALDILKAEFYWKESQKKIEEYKKSKRQERIEKKQNLLERDFSHGEGSSGFIGYNTIEDLERFCFTENQINSTGLSLAIDLIELYGLHEEILSKTGNELKGTAKLFKMSKIIRKYGVIQP